MQFFMTACDGAGDEAPPRGRSSGRVSRVD